MWSLSSLSHPPTLTWDIMVWSVGPGLSCHVYMTCAAVYDMPEDAALGVDASPGASAGSAGRHVEANDQVDVLDGLVAGDVVLAVGDVEHGHCTCWSMMETSVRRPRAGCCTRMMIGAP